MQTIVREIRGIPRFLLVEYLTEMGGEPVSENRVQAPWWTVTLERMAPFRIGSLRIGQTRLIIRIEDSLVEDFMAQLGQKTLRAGG